MSSESEIVRNSPKVFSNTWQKWIAESKLTGLDDEVIIAKLVEQGITEQVAAAELNAVVGHPYFQAAQTMTRKSRKLEAIVYIQNQLSLLFHKGPGIERRESLSKSEFLERYYSVNRPVILTDLMRNWRACSKWSMDYLKSSYGEEIVEIMVAVEESAENKMTSRLRKTRVMKFGAYVDLVESCGETNDHYLVANNRLMENPRLKSLYDDIEIFPDYLDQNRPRSQSFFWFGPAGTITPLHHDTQNILFAQVRGRKRVRLIAPEQTPLVYNSTSVFSDVDCEAPDYRRYPLFKSANIFDVVLAPGEVLFLPVGWWHHVRALDVSISITFTNLSLPNVYDWHHVNDLV